MNLITHSGQIDKTLMAFCWLLMACVLLASGSSLANNNTNNSATPTAKIGPPLKEFSVTNGTTNQSVNQGQQFEICDKALKLNCNVENVTLTMAAGSHPNSIRPKVSSQKAAILVKPDEEATGFMSRFFSGLFGSSQTADLNDDSVDDGLDNSPTSRSGTPTSSPKPRSRQASIVATNSSSSSGSSISLVTTTVALNDSFNLQTTSKPHRETRLERTTHSQASSRSSMKPVASLVSGASPTGNRTTSSWIKLAPKSTLATTIKPQAVSTTVHYSSNATQQASTSPPLSLVTTSLRSANGVGQKFVNISTTPALATEIKTRGSTSKPHRELEQTSSSQGASTSSYRHRSTESSTSQAASSGNEIRLADLLSIVNSAVGSMILIRDGLSRQRPSRPTRVVASEEETSAKLEMDPNKLATSEDIRLICKLLHEHVESASSASRNGSNTDIASNGTSNSQSSTISNQNVIRTTTSTTSTPKPEAKELRVPDDRRLNANNSDLLLESILRLEPASLAQIRPNESIEMLGQTFISQLFGGAYRARQRAQLAMTSSGGSQDYDSENQGDQLQLTASDTIRVRVWTNASLMSPENELHLVYWLLERDDLASPSRRWRLIDSQQAGRLLDYLDSMQLEQLTSRHKLAPILLMAPFESNWNHEHSFEPRLPVGESVTAAPMAPSQALPPSAGQPTNAFRALIQRLTNESLADNLYLYLILLLVALLLLILCFGLGLVCFTRGRQATIGGTRRRPINRRRQHLQEQRHKQHQRQQSDQQFDQQPDCSTKADDGAIWRKLSTSTSTLVRDESSCIVRRQEEAGMNVAPGILDRERRLHESSDSLTKSELVLVKEKLVPISRRDAPGEMRDEPRAYDSPSVVSNVSMPPTRHHDYVNRSAQTSVDQIIPDQVNELAGGHLMSASKESRPREVPPQLGSTGLNHVEAIKRELNRIEQRDRQKQLELPLASSYRRFDVT